MNQNKQKRHPLISLLLPLIVVTVLLVLPEYTRAQGVTEQVADSQTQWVQALNNIIGIISRLWIIPAKLAGILMTNYFVYWSSFYLVDYLFKFWQIIRTFALYALGLYFVGYILYSWFHPEEAKSKIADLFKNTLIAWILISMSRWLMAASVDLSIVFTSAVAAVPSQIYEQSREKKKLCFNKPIAVPIKADLGIDADLMGNPENHNAPERIQIRPEWSDISWPLMFFWAAVLKFFDNVYLPEQQLQWSAEDNQQKELSKTLIVVVVKALLAVMLIVPMIVLMVVNIIRVVYLWLRIVFAPGIVLINVFWVKISENLQKYISRQNILWLVMQPVAVVAMLSIGLIFMIELASVFNMCVATPKATENPLQTSVISEWVDAQIGESINAVWWETTLWASLSAVGDFVWGVTWEIIMALFVIILMRSLIKIWFSFSELTAGTAKSITDSVENIAATVPLVPLPGVGSVGMWAAQKFAKWWFWLNKQTQNRLADQEEILKNKLNLGTWEISRRDLLEIWRKAEKESTLLTDLKQDITEKTKKRSIVAEDAKSIVTKWLRATSWKSEQTQALTKLGLWKLVVNRAEKEEELKKIWEKWSTYHEEAYKLLNWLFWGEWAVQAIDKSTSNNQYWPYEAE